MRAWRAGAGILLFAMGCGGVRPAGGPAPQAAAGAGTTAPGSGVADRAADSGRSAVHMSIPVAAAFRDAVANGTRTSTGAPGPRYWQQAVNYRIDAELDPRAARLTGEEQITYVNASPDTLTSLVLHLYQNLFRAGAPRTEAVPTTGGMVLERVLVNGRTAREVSGPRAARPFYQIDHTVMGLGLARPLLPGDTARLSIAWHFTVPPESAPRMGHEGRELFQIAQWYPQVAVYDDVRGWDTQPYLGTGEFYLEYGNFDVSLTLPESYLVGATGTLLNPDEVLTATERERLALAMRVDTVVHVVGADEIRPGSITAQVPGGQLTWRFRARNVRDFAFSTSNRYRWDATHVDVPDNDGDGKPDVVAINAMYRAEARLWRRAALYTRHAIAYHSAHWLPYIYPQMTSAEGQEPGMEYPMLVFVSAYSDPGELLSVVTHEVGHEWFPMMVGSDEHQYAWQDEGLDSYIEALATADFSPGTDVWADDEMAYLGVAGGDIEAPMMRPADLYGNEHAYGVASYMKPALVVRALGTVIGTQKVHEALHRYAAEWLLKHPQAEDFFNVVNASAGQDLGWFWYPWFYTTEVLDQAIADVRQADGRTSITIENRGEIPMPVPLRLTLATGAKQDVTVPASVWFRGARRYTETIATPAAVTRVTIDPDGLLPDVDRANNDWNRK